MSINALRAKRNAGYTLDQTILIVAIIAILITLIVATIGWELLNRAGGTKLAAQFKQIEDSNGLFFANHGVWPHAAFAIIDGDDPAADPQTADEDEAMRLLYMLEPIATSTAGGGCPAAGTATGDLCRRIAESHANLIPGFDYDDTSEQIEHGFGGGGIISQAEYSLDSVTIGDGDISSGQYLVVRMESLPMDEAQEADQSIDGRTSGTDGYTAGRLMIFGEGDDCDTGTAAGATDPLVTICYIANLVNN